MPKNNLAEPNEAVALSMEEFILQHEYRGDATKESIERRLDEYLITVYGKDRYGFTNQDFDGVRREAEEVIFGSGDDGQYYLTDHELFEFPQIHECTQRRRSILSSYHYGKRRTG